MRAPLLAALAAAVTRLRVVGAGGATVALGTVAAGPGGALAAPVRGPMPPGAYQVEGRTMAADGHAVSGRYTLRAAAAAPAARSPR